MLKTDEKVQAARMEADSIEQQEHCAVRKEGRSTEPGLQR